MSTDSIYSSDSLCATKNVNTTKRLESLRSLMKKNDLGIYIVPSEDEHQSEYVSLADQRRSFISGFSGSAGIAIITRDLLNFNDTPDGKSALSTDGRYFNQASQELDYNWTLLKQGAKNEPTWQEWSIDEAIEQSLGIGKKLVRIGIDPKNITYSAVVNFQSQIKKKIKDSGGEAQVELVPVKENLVDAIWGDFEELPTRPSNNLLKLNLEYAGEGYQSKLEKLLLELEEKHSTDTILITTLDEVAWFLNLRGSDIEYNPVFFSYLLVSGEVVKLFTDNPYSDEIKQYFKENKIEVHKYQNIWTELSSLANALENTGKSILIPQSASWEIYNTLNGCELQQIHSPIDYFKSVKNSTEIENFKKAQLKDGVALAKYFSWLENKLIIEEEFIDEFVAAEQLIKFRKEEEHYMGNSFETISSTGANAAVIHYSPAKDNCSMIDPSKIYLCDSGSQFLEGTTDITRTYHFSQPTQEEINNFTYVLKGNLAIEQVIFPEGTDGNTIDCLARQFLWSQGLDYRHGTGHGVGAFLNVHEGPIGIGSRESTRTPMKKGNIITNEPGFYKDGEYGIRIENDMLVEGTDLKFGDKGFFRFKNLTLVPYGKRLINVSLLSPKEREIVDDYHKRIWTLISPFLEKSSVAYQWLKRETTPL